MNYTIHFLTIFTIVPHLSLFGQSDPTTETVGVQGQNRNQAVQTTTSGQPVNNRSTTRGVIQQNQQRNGYGSGGIGAAGYAYRVHNVLSRFPGTAENPLLVRSLDMDAKDAANLQEDLAVMQHILDKALDDLPGGQARAQTAMGINVFVTPNSSAMRSLYLEGYGALFLLNVGFPVLAPTSTAQDEKPAGDSAWEEARQELYGQSIEQQTLAVPGEEFSEEKVNRLKETLLRAMKNATNIRGLEGIITVCVLGGPNLVPDSTARIWKLDGANNGTPAEVLTAEAAQVHGTVLTIKVTKADVDAFARGELKFAEFQDRAQIATYSAAASGTSSGGVGNVKALKR